MVTKYQDGSGQGIEFEYKFLDINVAKTRKLIKKIGGKLIHKKMK